MRAVIIGGNGFIGSHLVDILLHEGWEVTVYNRSPERYRAPQQGVKYIQEDLGNTSALSSVLPGIDIVFHLASTTVPKSSNDDPIFDIESNLIQSVRLLQLCVKSRIKKVIFLSSGGTVYGIPQAIPIKETHPTNPICAYGITKLAIEKYLHLFKQLYGLSYSILRPSNPYGPRQNPDGQQGAIAVFLGRAIRGQPIKIWGDGSITRDYFYVSDLARACLLAANSEMESPVINIGSGQGVSLNQLLEIIQHVVEKPLHVIRLPSRPFDVSEVILDIEHARTHLGWQPTISLEQGVYKTWEWVQSYYRS